MANTFDELKRYYAGIKNRIQDKISKSLKKSAFFMAHQMDLSFENRGFLNPVSPRKDMPVWDVTSRAARMNRKNYPGGKPNPGKSFTQAQARYLFSSPTLVDTGALRASIGIEGPSFNDGSVFYHIGSGLPYVKTAEIGGTISVKGKVFDVPARPFQMITPFEETGIENIFINELGK